MKKIQLFIREQPLYAFVIGAVLLTVILGIAAFAVGRKPAEQAEEQQQEETLADEDTAADEESEESVSDEEDEEPVTEEEDEDEAEPTLKPKATEKPEATDAPTATPTPEEKRYNYNFLGNLYEDANCNGSRDSGEGPVTKSATVNLFKMPGTNAFESVTSDGSGHYSYNSSLKEGDTISLKAEAVAPEGYKINPKFSSTTFDFSSSKASQGQDIPMVPNDKVSQCSN